MDEDGLEISATIDRLLAYTAQQSGVAVLAHTDAGSADLFINGAARRDILAGWNPATAGALIRLRARSAKYYIFFDLLPPISPDLFIEMGELYRRELQGRLSPQEMDELMG
jgi:hypothetical protein